MSVSASQDMDVDELRKDIERLKEFCNFISRELKVEYCFENHKGGSRTPDFHVGKCRMCDKWGCTKCMYQLQGTQLLYCKKHQECIEAPCEKNEIKK